MKRKSGLEPLIDERSRFLILGTLPGDESLTQRQYYANPRNQFWSILFAVFDERVDSDYERRKEFLLSKEIALWDVLESACRKGSGDSSIKDEKSNDLESLFGNHPNLGAIGFNGTKAYKFFKKHVLFPGNANGIWRNRVKLTPLPSTSPTPGRYVQAQGDKIQDWKNFFTGLLP